MLTTQYTLQNSGPCEFIEDECLFLPSDFSGRERQALSLCNLANEESKLWEIQANNTVLSLRHIMKLLSVLQNQKRRNVHGQKESSRAHIKIQSVEFTRDTFLESYNLCREVLTKLGYFVDNASINRFPPLTYDDLFRKSTSDKRLLGDTYRPDGLLWVIGSHHPRHSDALPVRNAVIPPLELLDCEKTLPVFIRELIKVFSGDQNA